MTVFNIQGMAQPGHVNKMGISPDRRTRSTAPAVWPLWPPWLLLSPPLGFQAASRLSRSLRTPVALSTWHPSLLLWHPLHARWLDSLLICAAELEGKDLTLQITIFPPSGDLAQPCTHKCSRNILPLMETVKDSPVWPSTRASHSTCHTKPRTELGDVWERRHEKGTGPLRRELIPASGHQTEPNLGSHNLSQVTRNSRLWFQRWCDACGSTWKQPQGL